MTNGGAMYGSTADPFDAAGAILGGGLLVTLAVILISVAAYWLFFYFLIKTAVRNGVAEALRKTGAVIGSAGGGITYGYPPDQGHGAPPPPTREYR